MFLIHRIPSPLSSIQTIKLTFCTTRSPTTIHSICFCAITPPHSNTQLTSVGTNRKKINILFNKSKERTFDFENYTINSNCFVFRIFGLFLSTSRKGAIFSSGHFQSDTISKDDKCSKLSFIYILCCPGEQTTKQKEFIERKTL